VDTTRQDFLVGLLLIVTIAIVVGALIATSGLGERRYTLYMRAASAEGISADTRVLVRGLELGRVKTIVPRVDPATGAISFVAKLSLAETFQGGSRLELPLGTRAVIDQVSQISAAALIRLEPPDSLRRGRGFLVANDTIDSERRASPLDQLSAVAGHLSQEVEEVLHQSHRTLERVQVAVSQAQQTMRDLEPDVQHTLAGLAGTMGRVDSVMRRVNGAGLADSVVTTLATTDRLLERLDTLARDTHAMEAENRENLKTSVTNLTEASRQLQHFVDQLSARPYRLLTGVKPLPPRVDSTKAAADPKRDSVQS